MEYNLVVLGVYFGKDTVVIVFRVEFRRYDTERECICALRLVAGLILERQFKYARFVDKGKRSRQQPLVVSNFNNRKKLGYFL